jgi:hypothetical protein
MHRNLTTVVATTAIAFTALAGTASAATVNGTVVHKSKNAHSFAIADAHGHLTAIHAKRLPAVGRTVKVQARKLRNGTFAASRVTAGRAKKRAARISGLVTYTDQKRGKFVISARGVSLVVSKPKRAVRASAADPLPSPGTLVTVNSTLNDNGEIEADSIENDGENNNYADLEGRVLSIDTAARTLTITADDDDEIRGGTILVHLPATFDIARYHVGDVLQVVATPNADGSFTAVGTSQDGDLDEADSENDEQGDDADHDGADHASSNDD